MRDMALSSVPRLDEIDVCHWVIRDHGAQRVGGTAAQPRVGLSPHELECTSVVQESCSVLRWAALQYTAPGARTAALA